MARQEPSRQQPQQQDPLLFGVQIVVEVQAAVEVEGQGLLVQAVAAGEEVLEDLRARTTGKSRSPAPLVV